MVDPAFCERVRQIGGWRYQIEEGKADRMLNLESVWRVVNVSQRGTSIWPARYVAMGTQHGIIEDEKGQDQPPDKQRAQDKTPAAGPHAKPGLTDNSKTPGAGTLPNPGSNEDSTSG